MINNSIDSAIAFTVLQRENSMQQIFGDSTQSLND